MVLLMAIWPPEGLITQDNAHLRTDGSLFRVDVKAAVRVERTLYVQHVSLSEVRGFKDELASPIHMDGWPGATDRSATSPGGVAAAPHRT
jgi:hypothetical protein